jgi:hypothetical protein
MQQFLKEINEIVDFKKFKCTQSSKKKSAQATKKNRQHWKRNQQKGCSVSYNKGHDLLMLIVD